MTTPNEPHTSTTTGTRTSTKTKVIIAVVATGVAAAAGFGFFVPKYCKQNPDRCRRAERAAQEFGGSDDRRERGGSDDRRERGGSDDRREKEEREAPTSIREAITTLRSGKVTGIVGPSASTTRLVVGLDASTPSGIQTPGAGKELIRFFLSNPQQQGAQDIDITGMTIAFSGTFPPLPWARSLQIFRQDRSVEYGRVEIPAGTTITSGTGFTVPTRALTLTPGRSIVIIVVFDTTGANGSLTVSIPQDGITWILGAGGQPQRGADGLPLTGNRLIYN